MKFFLTAFLLSVCVLFGYAAPTNAYYMTGTISEISVQNLNGNEILVVYLNPTTAKYAGNTNDTGNLLGSSTRTNCALSIDVSLSSCKDMLALALAFHESGEQVVIATDQSIDSTNYSHLRYIDVYVPSYNSFQWVSWE